MREIKFRAWNKKLGQMRQILSLEMEPKEYPKASTRIAQYLVFDHPSVHSALIKQRFAKWPETDCEIMQYTGLKDKNDKEIYEGDLITLEIAPTEFNKKHFNISSITKKMALIVWSEDDMCFFLEFDPGAKWHSCFDHVRLSDIDSEVIGNIYEHPELIEVK